MQLSHVISLFLLAASVARATPIDVTGPIDEAAVTSDVVGSGDVTEVTDSEDSLAVTSADSVSFDGVAEVQDASASEAFDVDAFSAAAAKCSFPPFGKGGCKKVAIDGAKDIVKAFPCKIKEIGCYRKCTGSSDHCTGKANDLMVAKYGVKTTAGIPIAEWVMHHRGSLKLKYVIFGQRIWNPSRDRVTGWENWRKMENRGGVTANHWDHVHVSYK